MVGRFFSALIGGKSGFVVMVLASWPGAGDSEQPNHIGSRTLQGLLALSCHMVRIFALFVSIPLYGLGEVTQTTIIYSINSNKTACHQEHNNINGQHL